MQITGLNMPTAVNMSKADVPSKWLLEKFGQRMRPWQVIMTFRNEDLPRHLSYRFEKSVEDSELVPIRNVFIQSPESYQG